MSLKSLFSKVKSKHILSNLNVEGITEDVESGRYIDEYIKRKVEFEPHVDYATASNFAKFGLAEEYYDAAIKRIYQQYPYDGSSYEKIKWVNESNGLDLHVFENGYPRSHGYALFSPSGWGSRTSVSGNYGNPATKEYIYIKGGPNVDNIWHTASNRTSNLEIDGNKGNTIEFWLKKDDYQSLTKREVVFDSWTTGAYVGDHKYGRVTIELDSTNSQENSPWIITYRSGSAGIKNLLVSGAAGLHASASDGNWHHYAFSFQNTGSQVSYKMYVDGELNHSVMTGSSVGNVNTAIVAAIGALVAGKDDGQKGRESSETVNPGLGYGKLSGSIDEFRYWKGQRSSKDIGRHWFTQVHGGTNTDDANTDLGVYYKFNEGKTLTSSIDSVVLDYSGRVTNGNWIGYTDVARSVKSAIIQSSASAKEFADPIIHLENPKVNKYIDDTKILGRNHDVNSNSCIYYSFPGWIVEEEQETGGELKRLSQIIGSYFDHLFHQIEALSKIKHIKEEDYDKKPNPFMQRVLESVGFETPEIFIDADVLASLAARDEDREYEQRLEDVKNLIYRNIYNNLVNIYKSKGTEKAFRNLLRCYGIDEELIKINTYSDGLDYPVDQDYREDSFKSRCINFNRPQNFSATVYQYSSSFGKQDKSSEFPVSGYITGAHAHDPNVGLSFTTEAEIVFPYRHKRGSKLHFETPISASLFGAHTVPDSHGETHDLTWRASAKDFANFEVYAVKNRRDSRNAKFVFKSTSGIISPIESELFYDVYDGQKWNFAVRIVPKGKYGSTISGSTDSYIAELFGVKAEGSQVKDEFLLTASLTTAQGERFHKYSKRLFIGAHRQNFTGSTLCLSDVQVSSIRHWMSYLDNETIRAHSKDPKSFGVLHPMRNSYAFQQGLDNPVPAINTLALNWDFNTVTGSTKGGQLIVEDFSSGSFKYKRDYGWIGDAIGTNHPGRGDFFPSETTASIATAFFHTARQHLPENVQGSDMVQVLTNDERTFTRESRPVNYYFSIEKSMYQTISQEMLDMFATIKDFSNLIGDPVNRYRPNYKSMEKLRQLFFEKIENVPSIEKYIEFYKWVDASISIAMDQLKPASANFSEDVRNVIESHALERNKYWTKFPTLEGKAREPNSDGQILSINELTYNWRLAHAPRATKPAKPASGTVTIASNTDLNTDDEIRIVTTDGTIVTAKIAGATTSTDTNSPTFQIGANAGATATNLATCLDANSRLGASAASAIVTIKQLVGGTAGNTIITLTLDDDAGITKADFVGGRDLLAQDVNCRWWRERAEKSDAPLTVGDSAIDKDRDTIRRISYTDVSGSTYTLRRLTKPYRLQAELEPVLHGGSNYHLNKKKDFYLSTTNPGEENYIRISGSDVDFGPDCEDVHNPRYGTGIGTTAIEKRKARASADIAGTNSDHDVDVVAPFSLYSSSIDGPTDYKAEIYENFKKGVDITNLHSDAYGDDREIPIQSPFTDHWVGGHFHRHQHLNMMRPKIPQADPALSNITMSLDHKGRRFEAFHVTMSQGQLYVTSPNLFKLNHEPPGGSFHVSLTSSVHNRSRVLREPLAKRPVNIRNIKTTASLFAKDTVLNIGNYKHDYQIVQGTSTDMSPVFLIRTGSVEPVENKSNSPFFIEIDERKKYERPPRKHVFVNRFSAPGGPETAGDSLGGPGLDAATNQYSVYNSLNYRNLMTRLNLNNWSSERSGKFGETLIIASASADTAFFRAVTASYHKVYRNPRYVATASQDATRSPVSSSGQEIRPKYDNQFVQHQIPQSDLGYAWIRKSTIETTASYNRLESKYTFPKAQSDNTVFNTNLASAVDFDSPRFVSASEIGWGAPANDRIVLSLRTKIGTGDLGKFLPVDFLGLNTVVLDLVSSSQNTIGHPVIAFTTPAGGSGAGAAVDYLNTDYVRNQTSMKGASAFHGVIRSEDIYAWPSWILNSILLNRNGPYGYPSWKQLRAGEHPIARVLKKQNIVSLAVEKNLGNEFSPSFFTKGNYSWPENINHLNAETSRTVQNQKYRFTESAVTSKYHPLRSAGIFETIAGLASPIQSLERARGNPNAQVVVKKSSYGNKVTSFSNRELVNFLQINEKSRLDFLQSALINAPVTSIYSETIYPKDANSYLAKARGRQKFIVDWWSTNREDRDQVARPNSQGTSKLRDEVTGSLNRGSDPRPGSLGGVKLAKVVELTSSIWPLDAQKNFGTVAESGFIGHPGSLGEGELLSSYNLFRSSSIGIASMPVPAATYARKSEETPMTLKLNFESADKGDYWGQAADGEDVSFRIGFLSPSNGEIRFTFVSNETNALTHRNLGEYTYIPIQLTGTYTSPSAIASAFKDGVNSDPNWSSRKLGRVKVDGPTATIHFNDIWENANWSTTYGGYSKYFSNHLDAPDGVGGVGLDTDSPFYVAGIGIHLSASVSRNSFQAGAAKWEAGDMAGRYPFNYKDYSDYAQQMRLIGKDYSIVPEFRISDFVGEYVNSPSPDPFFADKCSFLRMTGALDDFYESSQENFFKVYGHSDFVNFFEVVDQGHTDLGMSRSSLTLKCKALKKFLPYEGVYPVQRSLQLATLFSQSYGPDTENTVESYESDHGASGSALGSWRNALAPFYSPGIMYNSIKSGIAVDYPLFVPKADRPFNLFCTTFQGSGSNRVDIGHAADWAKFFSGSLKRDSVGGISINMWVQARTFEAADDGTNAGSGCLIAFNDHASIYEGIRLEKVGHELRFFMGNSSGIFTEWETGVAAEDGFVDSGTNFSSAGPRASTGPFTEEDGLVPRWVNIGVTKAFNHTPPRFYLDGQEFTAVSNSAGSSAALQDHRVTMVKHTSHEGAGNCSIGNHKYGQSQSSNIQTALNCAIDEVTIWSGAISSKAMKALAGGGVNNRGPWRPDVVTEPNDRKKLVGWFRMGDDFGYTIDGISPVANMTNSSSMKNHAFPVYIPEAGNDRRTDGTGSVETGRTGKLFDLSSITKAKFLNFVDVDAGAVTPFDQQGTGITMVGQNGTVQYLTGAFKYPGYITGSYLNETLDYGIPRIGSASWGYVKQNTLTKATFPNSEFAFRSSSYWMSDKGQHLGVGQGGSGDVVKNQYNGIQRVERIPFEAIIDPAKFLLPNLEVEIDSQIEERFVFHEMEPHPSASLQANAYVRQPANVASSRYKTGEHMWKSTPVSSSFLTSSFNITQMRKKIDTEYSKAANNFFAESVKFFLAGGETTVISSEDTLQQPVRQGQTYKMRLRLYRVPTKDFPMYNRAAAFGMPVDAGPGIHNMVDGAPLKMVGHGYSPYTPPHYDSFGEVEYTFTPDIGVAYETIEDVINQISTDNTESPTIKYNRVITLTGSLSGLSNIQLAGVTNSDFAGTLSAATSSLNKSHAMQLSASFTGLGLSDANLISVFEEGGRDREILRKVWTIQSKWESPNFDFTKVVSVHPEPKEITSAKGMWHQTGSFEEAVTFVEIIPGAQTGTNSDLSSLLGMHFKKNGIKLGNVNRVPIGQLPEEKVIREAVVAVPFVEDQDGNRNFFALPREEVYKAVQLEGYPEYKKEFIDRVERTVRGPIAGRRTNPNDPIPVEVRPSVQSMVSKMMKYVIPPKMNFLKYNTREAFIDPFAMYIFEFEHTLTKTDIAYLWQNLPPDIGLDTFHRNPRDTLKAESIVSHDLGGNMDLLSGQFSKNVKWMVFKIKQRAETNYFKKMEKDRLPSGHPDKRLSVENDIFEYGFNWPYDYFSMVELIKLDAEVGFSRPNVRQSAVESVTGVGGVSADSVGVSIRRLITNDNIQADEAEETT